MKRFLIFLLISYFTFSVKANEYKVYFGNIHSHSSNSDGKGSALEAYTYARDVAKLDFFSLTDHMEQLNESKLEEIINAADSTRIKGVYETLWGFEWGSPIYNHSNLFMTKHFYSIDCYINDHINKFYAELIRYPPAIMQFNHPDFRTDLPLFNYRQYEYRQDIDEIISLIELKTPYNIGDKHELSYIEALDKGWHLSPTYNQDNHDMDWGTKNDYRTAVWLPELTRDNLIDGLKKGRTYAVYNKNTIIKWLCDGKYAGETIFNKVNVSCELLISDSDDLDLFSSVDIITNGGVIRDSMTDIKMDEIKRFDLTFSELNTWYYLRIKKDDNVVAITAPFYYKQLSDIGNDTLSDFNYDDTISDSEISKTNQDNNSGCGCNLIYE